MPPGIRGPQTGPASRPDCVSRALLEARHDRGVLGVILLLALAVRLWVLATHTYIAHPDETFQYLEPAHRIAFGSGVITWEYLEGIRSWLLPGALAGAMRVASILDPDPSFTIAAVRVLCVLASLAIPYAGYRIAFQAGGQGAAAMVGLFCALSVQAIYYAPVVMSEPLATDAALLAIMLGGEPDRDARRLLLVGGLFGLAAALRFQYAPVLGVVGLYQYARDWRALLLVASGGTMVLTATLGVLDTLTWGAPFASVWRNVHFNATEGISEAMGVQSWTYYPAYFVAAWNALTPILVLCLVGGARRAPALALAVAGIVGLHMIPAHKELRFILLATVCMPILIGIGLDAFLNRMSAGLRGVAGRVAVTAGLALALAGGTLRWATPLDDWHRDRGMLQAVAAARSIPNVCGLGIRRIWVYRSAGYSYWHRDAPLYFETWERAQTLPTTAIRLRLASVLDGKAVPQYPDDALAAHTAQFNALIGSPEDVLPGYTPRSCFGAGVAGDPEYCVFVRSGGCG